MGDKDTSTDEGGSKGFLTLSDLEDWGKKLEDRISSKIPQDQKSAIEKLRSDVDEVTGLVGKGLRSIAEAVSSSGDKSGSSGDSSESTTQQSSSDTGGNKSVNDSGSNGNDTSDGKTMEVKTDTTTQEPAKRKGWLRQIL